MYTRIRVSDVPGLRCASARLSREKGRILSLTIIIQFLTVSLVAVSIIARRVSIAPQLHPYIFIYTYNTAMYTLRRGSFFLSLQNP